MFTYIVTLNLTLNVYSQQSKTYFSDAVTLHLKKYDQISKDAVNNKNYERVDFLFDSIINNHLKGTYFENVDLQQLRKGPLQTGAITKPFIILTTTSWYINSDEEIEVLNQLASLYKDEVQLILLFWDTKKNTSKSAKKFNKDIFVTYIDETSNKYNSFVNSYKHALGYPTSFYVTEDKKIVAIDRGGIIAPKRPFDKGLFSLNYEIYARHIVQLLLQNELSNNTILSDTN